MILSGQSHLASHWDFYDGEICLGGGVIRATWNTTEAAA